MHCSFKIQIYIKNNNTRQNLYHTPYKPWIISDLRLILESRTFKECDADFAMYYSLFYHTNEFAYVFFTKCLTRKLKFSLFLDKPKSSLNI